MNSIAIQDAAERLRRSAKELAEIADAMCAAARVEVSPEMAVDAQFARGMRKYGIICAWEG